VRVFLAIAATAVLAVPASAVSQPQAVSKINEAREATHRCQDELALKRSPVADRTPVGVRYRRWVLALWQARKQAYCGAMRQLASYSEARHARVWAKSSGPSCVSSHEGAVTSNTGNGYYGKWQADIDFQRAYGREFYERWGTANNWPAWAQDVMARRGYEARGWGPWPTTSVICGLR
jgi:hypothetical protein